MFRYSEILTLHHSLFYQITSRPHAVTLIFVWGLGNFHGEILAACSGGEFSGDKCSRDFCGIFMGIVRGELSGIAVRIPGAGYYDNTVL